MYVNDKKIQDKHDKPDKRKGWYLTHEEYEVEKAFWTPVLGDN